MTKTKTLPATNGQKQKHKLPDPLAARLAQLQARANEQIDSIRAEFQRDAENLAYGFRAAEGLLDKSYSLSVDMKFLIEN